MAAAAEGFGPALAGVSAARAALHTLFQLHRACPMRKGR